MRVNNMQPNALASLAFSGAGLPQDDLRLIVQSVSDRKPKATDKSISKK